jgi:hypothetical protein
MNSELSLFDPPMVQIVAEKAFWFYIHPTSSIDSGPIEFHIAASQHEYLDLNDTILYIRLKVLKSTGGELVAKIYPANPLSSLFDDIRLSLNGTTVEGGYHLKAIMTSLLQLNAEAKRTELCAAGFQEDKAVRGR